MALSGNASAWQGCGLGFLPLADKLKSLLSGWVCFALGATTGCVHFPGELFSFPLDKGWALPFPFSRLGFNVFVSISFAFFPPLPAVPPVMLVT